MDLSKRLKSIDVIVSDVDGTLLKNDGTISKNTIKLVKELSSLGVIFTLATGRLHSATVEITNALGLKAPVISLDGSLIRIAPEGNIVFENFLSKKHVLNAIRYATENLFQIVLCHADAIYYTEHNSLIPDLLSKYGATYREVKSYDTYIDGTLEIVFTSENYNKLKKTSERFLFPYTFGCSISFFRSLRRENIYYLEVRKSGCDKGHGLKKLLKHVKRNITATAVLGDWYNDVSLFKTRALKVAVANAIPEIKDKADMITENTNDTDAVAEFLEKVLKAKKGIL